MSELGEKAERFLDRVDKRLTKQVSGVMKRHTTTSRFPQRRWEDMKRNAAFMGMTINAYVNLAVENQNAKYRKQQRDYLKSREEAP